MTDYKNRWCSFCLEAHAHDKPNDKPPITRKHKGETMKILQMTLAPVLLGLISTPAIAQEKGDRPAVVVAETNVVKATVKDIDHKKREVVLKDDEGNTTKMKVSEAVRNLDQVKKGDQIVAGYYQSAAISVKKPGEESSEPAQADAVIRSGKGETPGVMVVKTRQVTATVEDIDYSKREVKLEGPEGNTTKITVGDRVKRLEDVKKGDQIVARYTEALAVSLAKSEE